MNYTKQVRDYCRKNQNKFIDLSVVKNEFADIPYKTLLKIFNRLEEEGLVQAISKGVYSTINRNINEKTVLKEYTAKGKGMIVGYSLFNYIGLTGYQDDKVEIYTNVITSKQKTIGYFLLKKVDLVFADGIVDLISLLEILDVGFGMKGGDFITYKNTVELLVQSYNDENFKKANKAIHYKYSTIQKLIDLLGRLKIENSCLQMYQIDDI